jgi:hypothetical protein
MDLCDVSMDLSAGHSSSRAIEKQNIANTRNIS